VVKIGRAWSSARRFAGEFLQEAPFEKAAAVSYYALLALAPFLLLVMSIAGLAFGREAVQRQIVAEIQKLIGEKGSEAIELVLQNADVPGESVVSLIVGVVTLLVGASGVFVQLQAALNGIWDVRTTKKGPAVWVFLRHRLISMAMVLGLGFLMLVSLVISAGLSAVNAHYQSALPWPVVWQALNAGGSLVVITLLIGMIFRFLPDVRIAWRDVWLGALVTALLFSLGKYAIGLYLGRASIGSTYGAAGSVVVLVVWVYYASLIFFLGAQMTHTHARSRKARAAARAA
jgi:membrane protein